MAYSKGVKLADKTSKRIIKTIKKMVYKEGASSITVSRVIKKLGVSNRIFYNRFQNIEEALLAVSQEIIDEMRVCIIKPYNPKDDFYKYLLGVARSVLIKTYEVKKSFSDYMFNNDIIDESNKIWWVGRIRKLLAYGIKNKYIKPLKEEDFSYGVWCFCRGFNVDAIKSRLELKAALKIFDMTFGALIEGIKLKK